MSKKKIILIAVAVFLAIGIIGSMNGKKETVKVTTNEQKQTNNTNNTEKEQKKEPEKEKPAYEVTDVKIEKDEFSTYVTGILKNNTDKEKAYVQISFAVNDKDGNKVGTALDNISNLGAGKTWKFKAIYFGSEKDVKIELENPEIDGF